MNKLAIVGSLLAAVAVQWPVQAQNVWRCGADGRSFSDRPCSDGQALQMAELADTRSAAEVQAATEVAMRNKRLAESLRQERLAREQSARLSNAAPGQARGAAGERGFSSVPPASKSRQKARRQGPADDGTWRAVAPSTRRTKD